MGKRNRRRQSDFGQPQLEEQIWAVASLLRGPLYDAAIAELADHGTPAAAAAYSLLEAVVADSRDRGYDAADIEHLVTRRLSERHARVADGQPLPPGTTLEDALRLFVEVLELVARLPQEYAGSGRTVFAPAGTDGLDDRMLVRVRALLAKAESTEFPEEAEALTAKAQELIARHAIDAVLVGAGAGGKDEPAWRRVYLDDPYLDAKAMILGGVAKANRCTVVYSPPFGWCTAFGFPADLDATQLLTTSLLAQASHAMVRAGSQVDWAGRSRTRAFRRAFLVGFAERIAQRLQEATQAQVAALDRGALLPALAARDDRVEALRQQAYPTTVRRPTRISHAGGLVAGRAAADVADLSRGKEALEG